MHPHASFNDGQWDQDQKSRLLRPEETTDVYMDAGSLESDLSLFKGAQTCHRKRLVSSRSRVANAASNFRSE